MMKILLGGALGRMGREMLLAAGDAGAEKIWEEYLRNLSIAINNMRMLMDTEYIIAGHMLRYILPEDINTLQQFVDAESPFETRNVKIRMSAYPEDSAAPGAAIWPPGATSSPTASGSPSMRCGRSSAGWRRARRSGTAG